MTLKNVLLYGVIFFGSIIVFIVLGIYPNMVRMGNQNARIDQAETVLKEQALLYPLYTALSKELRYKPPGSLPGPEVGRLPRSEIGRLSDIFKQAALENGLEFGKVMPNINTLQRDSNQLMVDLSVNGPFFNLRRLLLSLAKMPYVDYLERIQIQRTQTDNSYGLRLWLNLE